LELNVRIQFDLAGISKQICKSLLNGLTAIALLTIFSAQAVECNKSVFLTFDTGNMAVAEQVADILRRQQVKATFFLANERTFRHDYALDDAWKPFWNTLVQEGHAFGSHTLHHTYFQKDLGTDTVVVKSQFGPDANKNIPMQRNAFCQQISAVDQRFRILTGKGLDKIWRAPGGTTSSRLVQFGKVCGFEHIGWSKAGFLGDELPSQEYPNSMLLTRALNNLENSNITMAHLGIWSRKDPWAPAVLEPLIVGLKGKGFCFKKIGENS
jgi:peptidoglycan/xylan/chitin deacetylase (PgdA/CDA1 family)